MNQEVIGNDSPPFSKLFYLICASNLLINLDHGIIPAASITIEESLDISNEQLGVLGSLVYAGIGIVGIFVGKLFMVINPSKMIVTSLGGMIGTLILFTINYSVTFPYYILRFCTGAFQAPLLIYFPVWVDHFGGKSKTIWLTILQGGVPFGVFMGYVLSSIIQSQWDWRWSFYLQVAALVPCMFGFQFVAASQFDVRIIDAQNQTTNPETNEASKEITKMPSTFNLLITLVKQKTYMLVMPSLCVLYFVVTGIQFWISNYMETVLGEPRHKVNIVFSVVSITAPTTGCILGGYLMQTVGGYESKAALPFSSICCLFGCLSAIPVPFVTSFWLISTLVWFLLFFGGAMVPSLTGIMITSVKSDLRSFANSTTTTFINLFGYLPAPSVYGSLSTLNDKAGITFLMLYPTVAMMLLIIALMIQMPKGETQENPVINEISKSELDDSQTSKDVELGTYTSST